MYVTATDMVHSKNIGKISKIVYVCNNSDELSHAERLALKRNDLRYVYFATVRPRYSPKYYHTLTVDYKGNKISSEPYS